ncbi:reverse transcriptase domain-containing protein, partial [Klebsiella pneumoniae]|uniref:reverse transcriptase domain-containing protein n=1 Tax=Klebsiella pneumoniae TaxID=573 RepID=UPI0040554B7B
VQFTRMPFGLKNAPITFQKLMDEFLRGVDEDVCQVYMDDLLVFSKTEKQHIEDLKSVFNRIRKFGLKLSAEKSLLGKGEITFLGHTITKEGVKPDKSKIDAISRMAVPRDVKGIRRLLGSLNYYRRFVPGPSPPLLPNFPCRFFLF